MGHDVQLGIDLFVLIKIWHRPVMGKMILIENETCRERDNGMCVYDTGLSINEGIIFGTDSIVFPGQIPSVYGQSNASSDDVNEPSDGVTSKLSLPLLVEKKPRCSVLICSHRCHGQRWS